MHSTTMVNPKTNRTNKVRAWAINPRAIYDGLRSGEIKSAKDISWSLLNDNESYQTMINTEYGDAAESNWTLSIFENALDWTLGLKVLQYIMVYVKEKRLPKPFTVMVNRQGNVYIRTASGKVL